MADSPDLPPLPSDPAAASSRPGVPPPAPQPRRWAGLHALWTLVVRLIMLGAGVSLGWLVGMVVAQAWPARNPEPPLTEVALRYGSQTGRKLRQLPRWWQGDVATDTISDEVAPATEASSDTSSGSSAAPAPAPVPEADRDRIQTDLTTLRQDLASLNTRLSELEATVGTPPTGTLEDRLQRLDQRLATSADAARDDAASEAPEPAEPEPAEPEPSPETAPVARVPYQEPRFPLVRDRVILPSVLLFEPGGSSLTTSGQQLLDSIASDLRRYGATTLLVGSHTDGSSSPDLASQLTLQQAVAVQQYLAPQIEADGIRWVPVGYGQTRPTTAGTTAADQQRNQRVEIGIVPRN